jgi:polysaccharide export outer membrane protein
VTLRGNVASPGRYPWKDGLRISDLILSKDFLITREYWERQNHDFHLGGNVDSQNQDFRLGGNGEELHGELLGRTRAEVNWDYAVIERLKKDDLTTILIPFNLGNALERKDTPDNQKLEAGDIITIFSKDEIKVPIAEQSVYVRLEGEVNFAGVYQALPGETLRQLIARIGGLTPNAYLFGAELDRESVRIMQQKRLQEMADRMETDIKRNLAAKQHSATTQDEANSAKLQAEAQAGLVEKLRNVRATGRVVLGIPPRNAGIKDLPDFALEDGDHFVVPSKPSTASVMGMVYNENSFIFKPGARVADYLAKAGGPTRDADESRIYLLRADGSVLSAQNTSSIFGSFSSEELMSGDTVVVPELLDKFALTKELKDWAQIFYQFALGVAGIKLLKL